MSIENVSFEKGVVFVTPHPGLVHTYRPDHRMSGLLVVFHGVLILGGITAADCPASETHP